MKILFALRVLLYSFAFTLVATVCCVLIQNLDSPRTAHILPLSRDERNLARCDCIGRQPA